VTASRKPLSFCVDTEHAARMRQALINENPDLAQQNERYVMRITGDDAMAAPSWETSSTGSQKPGIVTTSRLPLHRRGRTNLPPHRPRPRGGIDDRV